MTLIWRRRIFIGLLISFLTVSLAIKFYDFFYFLTHPPVVFGEEERKRYPNDYALIEKALSLPLDARILVLKRLWIANYYLYPRRLYFLASKSDTREELIAFIHKYKIGWVSNVREDKVNLINVESPR